MIETFFATLKSFANTDGGIRRASGKDEENDGDYHHSQPAFFAGEG
jgi:hypothetical protein